MEDKTWKIVAALKKRGLSTRMEYSYVPSNWERNGTLYWPTSNASILRRDPCSIPEDDWTQYSCKMKKDQIHGFEEAELWEEEFVNASNTEAEENLTISPKRKRSEAKLNNLSVSGSYDELFKIASRKEAIPHQNIVASPRPLESCTVAEQEIVNSLKSFDTLQSGGLTTERSEIEIQEVAFSFSVEEFLRMQQKIDEIDASQKRIEASQKRFTERLDSTFLQMKTTLDKIYSMLKEKERNSTNNIDTTSIESTQNISSEQFIFPLDSVELILKFEKYICNNNDYKSYLIEHFASVGGTGGNEDGKCVAKKMLSMLFTRSVLTSFSWTGISRTSGVEKKKSFQSCEGILSIFFSIIYMADSRWTKQKNEKFFKYNILKHAKQISDAFDKKNKNKILSNDNQDAEYGCEKENILSENLPVDKS